jgi:hypothetical protein
LLVQRKFGDRMQRKLNEEEDMMLMNRFEKKSRELRKWEEKQKQE